MCPLVASQCSWQLDGGCGKVFIVIVVSFVYMRNHFHYIIKTSDLIYSETWLPDKTCLRECKFNCSSLDKSG